MAKATKKTSRTRKHPLYGLLKAVFPAHKWTVLLPLCCAPAFCWGPEGHALVARLADTQLTPGAREKVAAILGPGKTIVSVASWADEVRRTRQDTGPWHYIDIPIDKSHLDMARDCPNGDCITAKIADLRKAVRDPETPPEQRREALMFVVHFIGDLHQPLHCSERDKDRGGNEVHVQLFDRQTNLHSTWDSGLLNRMPPADSLFAELSARARRQEKKWSKGTVDKWAEQSHNQARKVVYGKLPKAAAGQPVQLGAPYLRMAEPVIKEQIAKAGVRLAAVLNSDLQ